MNDGMTHNEGLAGAPPPEMTCALSRLDLTDFRSHAVLSLTLTAPLIVLTGPNGAGKTNILEAVSMLVAGRGLRRAALPDMARQGGAGGFTIHAQLGEEVSLGTGMTADAPGRRKVRINGAPATTNDLNEWLAMLWLTPAMDRLFQEGAGERRRFLDRMVLALDPAHARRSTAYETAMRDRNRLLTEWPRVDAAWLDALEAGMAEHGAAIASARSGLLAALQPVLDAAADGPFARPSLALMEGEGEGPMDAPALAAALKSSRARDAAAGRTLIGPHRADLAVTYAAKGQAAAQCSTGEQKALLLSLILGQAELVADRRGMPPVLLLDEVAAHLDAARRDALFARLAELGGQIWMTGTDTDAFSGAFARGAQSITIGG